MGSRADDAVPQLIDRLDDPEKSIRVRAARALGQIGDFRAVPSLDSVASDKQAPTSLRDAAKSAVAKIGPLNDEQKDWADHSHSYLVVHGELVKLPPFRFGYPSSRCLTVAEAQRYMRQQDMRGLHGEPQWNNPAAVAVYANVLPDAKVGEYGWIDSSHVLQVIGPDEMLIVVAGNEERTVRVVGCDTAGLVDGQWLGSKGLHEPMAIVGTSTYGTGIGSNTVFLAVPVAIARRGISFENYVRLVHKGG
jgi:uncharacterized protein (UPF0147 family)